jgi:type IV pilus assembly protein PilA
MLARIRKMQEEHEEGFTLIELLVVIIIIGILAAIAIPVFLSQRNKGYDAGVKSDLRNAATAEETYLTDNNEYTDSEAALLDAGFNESNKSDYKYAADGSSAPVQNGNLSIGFVDGTGDATTTDKTQAYCIEGTSASGAVWSYNSAKGGLQPKGDACP